MALPMVYMIEQFREPTTIQYLKDLDQLNGDLTTHEALALMQQQGITHVFIGEKGGNIVPEKLISSPHFLLEYQQGLNYVFRVKYADQ